MTRIVVILTYFYFCVDTGERVSGGRLGMGNYGSFFFGGCPLLSPFKGKLVSVPYLSESI